MAEEEKVEIKDECQRLLNDWWMGLAAICEIPRETLPSYGKESHLSQEEQTIVKAAVANAKRHLIGIAEDNRRQLEADLDGIIEDGETTKWQWANGAEHGFDETLIDVKMSAIADFAIAMIDCECPITRTAKTRK